jgi:hypothetical protein
MLCIARLRSWRRIVNVTTDGVDNATKVPVCSIGNSQVTRSVPRPPGKPDTCLNRYN